MKPPPAYPLFARFGVELEYMIVDAKSLEVRPEADELIREASGSVDGDVCHGRIDWSNELALHLIELKTARPARSLDGLASAFAEEVNCINRMLAGRGARLLPTAMHPWMNPRRQGRLWPHSNQEIYAAFHQIFDCRGHGWTNLQSAHLNLPFASEDELVRLHAALRILIPLLPALTASSPFIEGKLAPNLDQRLEVYRHNCRRIPSMTGLVVPEPLRSSEQYQRQILGRIYRDLAPHDSESILRDEWANARGAIVRFQRNTIELRVLDVQECPAADLALLQFIVRVVRDLTEGAETNPDQQNAVPTSFLQRRFLDVIRDGGEARIPAGAYARVLGFPGRRPLRVRDLWQELWTRADLRKTRWSSLVELVLRQGSLAERLRRAVGPTPTRARLKAVYSALADCLEFNTPFVEHEPQ